MKITKGEYCQFSLKSRLQLLKEFGQLEFERTFGNLAIRVFTMGDFYVEVTYNKSKGEVVKAEPFSFQDMLHLYIE